MSNQQHTRRDFHKTLGASLALGVAPAINVIGANERINIGVIGCGGRGQYDLSLFLRDENVRALAICDVDQERIDQTRKDKLKGDSSVKAFKDFRDLLEINEIDAVIIGTPDHWHAIPFVRACEAGKDVYCEKPLALTIGEGRKMVTAARKHKRVTQIGTQQRTIPHFKQAVELLHSGKIGKMTHVECWNVDNRIERNMGAPPDSDPPAGLDYDMWLGQAPMRPYNRNRCRQWRWFWDYSGGQMTDWGTHHMDIARWAVGAEYPISASATGGKFALPDNSETPDTMNAVWEYDGGVTVSYMFRMCSEIKHLGQGYGMMCYGTDATLFMNRSGFEITPIGESEPVMKESGSDDTYIHVRNFLDCLRSRKLCNADVEIGHRSTLGPHLANIAQWSNEKLTFDGETETIINHPECNRFLDREKRPPWTL
ncbi:MAG: Gfo/Idh/MocA family oxidoreductase [Candidatus Hinthialibacter antarcticus]|nr:Gfo/Idh/MocA family oxidoreductase [Candidatus Hinthialibacter antarcticus]